MFLHSFVLLLLPLLLRVLMLLVLLVRVVFDSSRDGPIPSRYPVERDIPYRSFPLAVTAFLPSDSDGMISHDSALSTAGSSVIYLFYHLLSTGACTLSYALSPSSATAPPPPPPAAPALAPLRLVRAHDKFCSWSCHSRLFSINRRVAIRQISGA